MGGSSGPAPKSDPNIGLAAMKSAATGEKMLSWMQDQAKITNQWAADDRERDINVFRPLQDKFIAEAQTWDTPERQDQQAAAAEADVNIAAKAQGGAMMRDAASMGVNPNSGRFLAAQGRMATDTALAAAGAGNLARRQVRLEGDAKKAQAINLGSGFAVNPGQSMGLSNGAAGAGFSGAMQGYGQQGNLLNADFNNQMNAYQADQQGKAGLFGGLGTLLGAGMGKGGFLTTMLAASSKDYKTDKKAPAKSSLGAIRKMPVEEWTYKKGIADEGRHIGPYAEDFQKHTGRGDGKTIPLQDMIGVTMGAVKELADKVDKISATIPAMGAVRKAA